MFFKYKIVPGILIYSYFILMRAEIRECSEMMLYRVSIRKMPPPPKKNGRGQTILFINKSIAEVRFTSLVFRHPQS